MRTIEIETRDVPRDMAVHDPAEAEHHWRTLVPLFDDVLKK